MSTNKKNPISFVSMSNEPSVQTVDIHPEKLLSFDQILSSKINFGKFQYLSILLISMISVTDGAEALVLAFLTPVLESEWKITQFQQSMLGSSVFIGFFIGCIISGQLGDRYGRRKPLIVGVFFNFVFGFASGLSTNFTMLAILRGLFGVAVGIISPLSATFVCEITPQDIRGRVLVFYSMFFTLGELLTCFIAYLVLNDLNSGNWRALIMWSSVPGMITFFLCLFYLEESPRYLIVFQKYNKFFPLVNKILKFNHKDVAKHFLTQEEIIQLSKWGQKQVNLQGKHNASPKELFTGERKRITPFVWVMWYVLSCVYYGVIFVLPEILKKMDAAKDLRDNVSISHSSQDFANMAFSVFSEFPSSILTIFIIEIKFFGRKNSICFTFLLTSIVSFGSFFTKDFFFIILATMSRFFLNIAFSIIYPYTTEIYPTAIRATGLGIASACSRIGGITMPWISFASFSMGTTGPFLSFGILSFIAFLAGLFIPYDTTGIELDKHLEGEGEGEKDIAIEFAEMKLDGEIK